MKYAILDGGALRDVVEAPTPLPNGAPDVAAWLAIQFPTLSGWIPVADNNVNGATGTPPGPWTNPPPPLNPLPPLTLIWAVLIPFLIATLGGGSAGRAALGNIITSAASSPLGGNRFFAFYMQSQSTFTKSEFIDVLADVSPAIVSNARKALIETNWPTG